ncbi:hypothetical protein [Haloterrigena turkmenica]|nr:hypothetical protein [Haloterrigena turkmenica]
MPCEVVASSAGPKVPRAVRAATPREDEASDGLEDAKRLPVDEDRSD